MKNKIILISFEIIITYFEDQIISLRGIIRSSKYVGMIAELIKIILFFIKKVIFPKFHTQVLEIFKSIDMYDFGPNLSEFYLFSLWELLDHD